MEVCGCHCHTGRESNGTPLKGVIKMDLTSDKARRIVSNIRKVVREKNIDFLSKAAYQFIILKMGFIAHYDLHGFRCAYSDLRSFLLRLQTSEYSNDKDYNLRSAERQEGDLDFKKWYGEENQKSTAWAIREIVMIAREYEKEIATCLDERQKQEELKYAGALAAKYGYSLSEGR